MARQTKIPGTFDEVPQAVQEKADEYVKVLRARQSRQAKEGTLRAELLELMHEHSIERIELDDEKDLVLVSKGEAVKIKKKSAPTSPDEEGDEGDE